MRTKVGRWLAIGLVVLVAHIALAEESAMPLRSFERFELDSATADGLWAELGSVFEREEEGPFELDVITTFLRVAYGWDMLEAGILIPYHHVDLEAEFFGESLEEDGLGDIDLYGKIIPLRSENLSAGLGFAFSVPSGDEDDGLGAGEVGFLPFGTAGLHLGTAEIGAHFGYQFFTEDDEGFAEPEALDAFVYGAGLHVPIGDMLAARLEFLGLTVDAPGGSNPDLFVLEPGVDIRLPLGMTDLLLRPTGRIGLNDDAPDWGVGGSVAVAWLP